MLQTITAIYEQGRLRPLQPLNLRENETVQIQLLTARSEVEAALMALANAGLLRLAPLTAEQLDVTDEQRLEAAQALGEAGPVSELILQDRG